MCLKALFPFIWTANAGSYSDPGETVPEYHWKFNLQFLPPEFLFDLRQQMNLKFHYSFCFEFEISVV